MPHAADLQHLADAASAPHYDQERWLSRYQMLESRAREAELQVVSLRIERDTVRPGPAAPRLPVKPWFYAVVDE